MVESWGIRSLGVGGAWGEDDTSHFVAGDVIEEFINESRALYDSLNFNISSILQETQLIIGAIDSLVSDLGGLYNELNKVRDIRVG